MGYIHFRFVFTLSIGAIELLDCEFRFKLLAHGFEDRHYQYQIANLDVTALPEVDAPPRPQHQHIDWRWPLRGSIHPWFTQWPHVNEGVDSPTPSIFSAYRYQDPEVD
jgi:hypothetical protein